MQMLLAYGLIRQHSTKQMLLCARTPGSRRLACCLRLLQPIPVPFGLLPSGGFPWSAHYQLCTPVCPCGEEGGREGGHG